MIVGVERIPTSFDVEQHWLGCPPEALEAHLQTYDCLLQHPVRTDASGHPALDVGSLQPALAQSWEFAKDRRSCTFQLRKGVISWAGNELTAHDVKWSWERAFALNSWSARALRQAGVSTPDAIRLVQNHTLQVVLDQPNPRFERLVAGPFPPIYDMLVVREHCPVGDPWGNRWLSSHTAGFGPYVLGSSEPAEAVFVANEEYYAGSPRIKRLMMRPLVPTSARAEALLKGSIDIAADLPAREIERLAAAPGVRVFSFPGERRIMLRVDPAFAPFDQPAVIRAISLALPYKEIATEVFGDERARPSLAEQDIRGARQLMREAGYGSGFRVNLRLPEHEPDLAAAVDVIRRAWMRLDIKVVTEGMPLLTLSDHRRSRQLSLYLEEQLSMTPAFLPSELDPQPDVQAIEVALPALHFVARDSVTGFVHHPDGRPRYFDLRKVG